MEQDLKITEFFDMESSTLTYVVHDEISRDAIVIDPVMDGPVKEYIYARELRLRAILETHAHADHRTGSSQLKKEFSAATTGIGERIVEVQKTFKEKLGLEDLQPNGSQFDLLLRDFETYHFGSIPVKTIPTPGHTPCCLSYQIGSNVFTGDALFMPDFGTGRCDFPGGSAKRLFHSISQELYTLPDEVKVFVGHDYCPGGRALAFQSTIGDSKQTNKHIKMQTSEEEYVKFRQDRDRTLEPPKNLDRNIAFNISAGKSDQ